MKTRVIQDDSEPADDAVDRQAPVVGTCQAEIAAARDVVWEVLTAVERWPSWNPDVKSASMRGGLAEGSEFRWTAGPTTITSTIRQVRPPRLISWTGRTLGIDAVHVYALEARDGTTIVRTEESYDGLVARLFGGRLQKTLDSALANGLRHLKAEAERQATDPTATRRS
jgi:uncharacterized protein YndB with AHSA1/START domain